MVSLLLLCLVSPLSPLIVLCVLLGLRLLLISSYPAAYYLSIVMCPLYPSSRTYCRGTPCLPKW